MRKQQDQECRVKKTSGRCLRLEPLEDRSLLNASGYENLLGVGARPPHGIMIGPIPFTPPYVSLPASGGALGVFPAEFTTSIPLMESATPEWAGYDIDARSIPANATIDKIILHQAATHPRVSDLQVKLFNDSGTEWMIRQNTGGWIADFDEYRTDTTVFAGDLASQIFHYRIADTVVNGLQGSLTSLEMWIHYTIPTPTPDLTVTTTHTGNFIQGQTDATWAIHVANLGDASTSGAVNVQDLLPAGLTATAISGAGWTTNLLTLSATRSDALATGASYPPIIVTVSVANDAPASVLNSVQVSGTVDSNPANNAATDTISILPLPPSPTIFHGNLSVSHARDGQTITVGYQISSAVAESVLLDFSIVGPEGIAVKDPAHAVSVDVAAGTQWYTRSFAIRLPPTATPGAYSVTWAIRSDVTGDSSMTSSTALTIEASVAVRIPAIMYHNVATIAYDYWTVTIPQFIAQMRALKAYGYTSVTTQDLLDYRAGVKTPPTKPILITFDDGYESLLTIVSPILADPTIDYWATVFVDTVAVRPEEEPGGYPTDFLSWSQIRELQASGRWDIQSHTVNHDDLTTLDPAALVAELVDSKNLIQQELGGTPVNFIAYPYGASNATVEMAAWQAGYSAGFRVDDEIELTTANKFALTRMQMDMDTSMQLDQSGWYHFFLTKIEDPDIVVPELSVAGVDYLDPITQKRIDLAQVKRGQTVLIKVHVNNAGSSAGVIATLTLGSTSYPNSGVIYNSHATTPVQDIQKFCPWQTATTFEWTWTVPRNAPPGQYHLNVSFHDPLYVAILKNSGWMTKFHVSANLFMGLPSSSTAPAGDMSASALKMTTTTSAQDLAVANRATADAKAMASLISAKQTRRLMPPVVQWIPVKKQNDTGGISSNRFAALHDAVLADESLEDGLRDLMDP